MTAHCPKAHIDCKIMSKVEFAIGAENWVPVIIGHVGHGCTAVAS